MKLTPEQQAELMARVVRGDQAAFNELHGSVSKQIFGYIRIRTNNDADASDILQETWLKFWRSLRHYDAARGSCLTFVYRIAYSVLVDYYRAHPQWREVLASQCPEQSGPGEKPKDLDDLLDKTPPGAVVVPHAGFDLVLEETLVRAAFEGTSPPHQLLAFGMAELQRWTPGEIIAELCDLQLRAIEGRLEADYAATSKLSGKVVEKLFAKLRNSMDRLLGEMLEDSKTRELYDSLLETIVGDSHLREYFRGDSPSQNISHWCQAVQRRVRSAGYGNRVQYIPARK